MQIHTHTCIYLPHRMSVCVCIFVVSLCSGISVLHAIDVAAIKLVSHSAIIWLLICTMVRLCLWLSKLLCYFSSLVCPSWIDVTAWRGQCYYEPRKAVCLFSVHLSLLFSLRHVSFFACLLSLISFNDLTRQNWAVSCKMTRPLILLMLPFCKAGKRRRHSPVRLVWLASRFLSSLIKEEDHLRTMQSH